MSVELRQSRVVVMVVAGVAMAAGQAGTTVLVQSPPLSSNSRIPEASNPEAGDHFGCGGVLDGHAGWGVAISGDGNTMPSARRTRAAARRASTATRTTTRCRCRRRLRLRPHGTTWSQQAYLKASNPEMAPSSDTPSRSAPTATRWPSRRFGKRASATGVNGNQDDSSIPQAGAAYVFTRRGTHVDAAGLRQGVEHRRGGAPPTASAMATSSASRWRSATTANARRRGDHRGQQRAASTATRRQLGTSAGAVYVFARTGTTWAQQAYVKAAEPRCRRPVRLLRLVERRRRHARRRQLRRGRLLARDQRAARQHAARLRRRLRLHARGHGVGAAGLHPRLQCRGRRLVRRQCRARATMGTRCWRARSTKTAPRPA